MDAFFSFGQFSDSNLSSTNCCHIAKHVLTIADICSGNGTCIWCDIALPHVAPPQATGSGSINNPQPRIGASGHRLFNWPLDPSSLLSFCWVDGSSLHINHLSTSLMTQPPLTHFTNLATMMASGGSSQSSLMPWLPIALPTTTTPALLPQSQSLHFTLP